VKPFKWIIVVLLFAGSLSFAQTTRSTQPAADVRSFQVAPAAPPQPALKYQLLYNDLADRLPGDASVLYLDAVLLMGPDAKAKAQKALDAHEAKDMKAFEALADELALPTVFAELDLAARREECNWEPPFREQGAYTYLPHLEPLFHGVGKLIKVRALRQIGQGKTEEALHTLRLGYELGEKVGREPILISGLVSLGITSLMNDALTELMNRPDAPNLYWALAEHPSRRAIYRRAMQGERGWVIPSVPYLARVRKGEQLTADQWRAALDYVWGVAETVTDGKSNRKDPVKDARPETLKQARQQYGQPHALSADQVAKLDPIIPLGEYYFRRYEVAFDEMYKLRSLPYPAQLERAKAYRKLADDYCAEMPGNPFQVFGGFEDMVARMGRADRQVAALTVVEAIRSYASANNGALPKRLEDVTETPVPENPLTGAPFEYRVAGDSATLSDTKSDTPLTYTVSIRR
jgi:hypothetical protein